MAAKSVYLPVPVFEGGNVRIEGDEHRHLSVARVAVGERIEVFDGKGTLWISQVVRHSKRDTLARILEKRLVPGEPYEVILGLSLVRPASFELALEKAVEVGVTRIIPLLASRSNTKTGRREERWTRIVIEAAKQSKRYRIPQLSDCVTVDQILDFQAPSKIVFAERGGGSLQSAVASGAPVLYVVGPEGGWTDPELSTLQQAGFKAVGLGKSILKTETAAIVGAALILYELQSR